MLTSVIPSMLMYEAGGVEQLMYRTNQPVVKTARVHKQHLFSALHTDLARTCGPCCDDHIVDAGAVGRDKGDTGGP